MSLSIPGKAFLSGEYAVLVGAPAVVVAVPPRFLAEPPRAGDPAAWWDPGIRAPRLSGGLAGQGSSTAEFLAARAFARGGVPDPGADRAAFARAAWEEYRVATRGEASGADLVAQAIGGALEIRVGPAGPEWRAVALEGLDLALLSATHQPGRKLATHRALGDGRGDRLRSDAEAGRASDLVAAAVEAALAFAETPDVDSAGRELRVAHAWARGVEALVARGWETEAAAEDRRSLARAPGVIGAKGAGAGLNDSVWLLFAAGGDPAERAAALAAARARDLNLVWESARQPAEGGLT